jgi:hypothetical protein
MELELYRLNSQSNSTLGVLYRKVGDAKEYLCFTLEDEYREQKVFGETRIPKGTYQMCLRQVGKFDTKYSTRFKDIHKGMLWLQDVPEFKYILVHCGNTEEDTAGCLLLGYAPKRVKGGNYELYSSTLAYMEVYPAIAEALEEGEEVNITIFDFDEGYKFLGQ